MIQLISNRRLNFHPLSSMRLFFAFFVVVIVSSAHGLAGVEINEELFGRSLGGWTKRDHGAAEYPLSGAVYRTYKPEISPTPDGGIFVSVRIDNVRGWLSTDDHAVLEITVSPRGGISSAQSSIAIQGKSIKSEMILGGNEGGKAIMSSEGAVRIGTDLVADLSAKLLRENIVEAGRVSFPAVLRHNYNRLFQAIQVIEPPKPPMKAKPVKLGEDGEVEAPSEPLAPVVPVKPEEPKSPVGPVPETVPLQVKPYGL